MFFTQKKIEETVLIIDIGTSSVGAALVSVSKNAAPKIRFSTRTQVVLKTETERSHSVASVVHALDLVIKAVVAEHVVITKSHIFFSSPWYLSETKVLKKNFDSSTLVTHHIIEQLTKEAEGKIVEESHSDGEVVESRIIRSRLNGYDTPNPYNKKAKNLEVTLLVSIVARDILESVRRVVENQFHIQNNEVSSFSLAIFSAIAGILPAERDYLIVDVRGGVTDISLITDGALTKSKTFPQGKNALVKSYAHSSRHSLATSLSAISTTLHGDSEPTVKAKVEKITEAFKQTWLQSYNETIQELSNGTVLPQTIFLIADLDIELFFENILNEIKKDNNLYLLKHLNVRNYVETSSVLVDQFLALESIFVTMVRENI